MGRLQHSGVFLLLWAIFISSASASYWSSSSSDSGGDGDAGKATKDDAPPQATLVSPIVNRELEASVLAHSWPTTPQSVFCEGHAYHSQDGDPGVAFLDRLVPLILLRQLEEDKDATTETQTISYQNATDMVMEASPLSAAAKRLLEYALKMRASSPQCELHRGLARESLRQADVLRLSTTRAMDMDAFCVVQGKVMPQHVIHSMDWSSLAKTTTTTTTEGTDLVGDESLLLPDEIPIGGSDNNGGPLVILYANLGSVAFAHMYQNLVKAKVRFVVRHLGAVQYEEDPTSAIETVLQGYGVRLDIRNVEYKVFDDRSDNKLGGSQDAGMLDLTNTTGLSAPPQYLAGVNLTALGLQNQPTLVASLWRAHDGQQAQSQILPPVWQRRQLPLQAAAVIASSVDPLVTLQEVSQDLPSVASTLAYVKIPDDIQKMAQGLEENKLFRSGRLYINGRATSMTSPSFNVFVLLNLMREEQAALDGMQSLLGRYLEPAALRAVQRAWMMGDDFLQKDADDLEEAGEPSTVDTAFRVDIARGGKQAIMYLNNVEKDRQYAQWPRSLQQMLMGMQYGMPPAVRRNLFTVLAVLDPISSPSSVGFDFGLQLMDKSFPIRIGVLLVNQEDVKSCAEWLSTNTDVDEGVACPVKPLFESKPTKESLKEIPATAQAVHRLFSVFSSEYSEDPGASMSYLEYYLASLENHKATKGDLYMSDLITLHGDLLAAMRIMGSAEGEEDALAALLEDEDTLDSDAYVYGRAVRFAAEKGVSAGMSFLNGRPLPTDAEDGSMNSLFGDEQNYVFGLIVSKEITDNNPKSVYAKLLTGKRVFKKCHPLLLGGQENALSYLQLDHNFGVESLIFPDSESTPLDANFVVEALLEFDTEQGVKILSRLLPVLDSFLSSLDSESGSAHFGYRIMPSTISAAKSALCPILAHASLLGASSVRAAVEKVSLAEDNLALEDILNSIPGVRSEARELILSGAVDVPCSSSKYLGEELPAKNFILGNGRLYAVDDASAIGQEDIELLMTMELERAKAVAGLLKDFVSPDRSTAFDTISRATAFLAVAGAESSVDRLSLDQHILELEEELEIGDNPLRFTWNTESDAIDGGDAVKIHAVVVIDPLSDAAQRVSTVLQVIRDQLKIPLTLILSPATLIDGESDVPITSYYRFVADSNAMPDSATPKAHFSNLPANHLLTLRMDVPEPWDVQQTKTVQDTDNLRCDLQAGCSDDAHLSNNDLDVPEGQHLTSVEYGLSGLLFFGQCYEPGVSRTNGLQLTLSKNDDLGVEKHSKQDMEVGIDGSASEYLSNDEESNSLSVYSDTLVMKTVGYWQLRAKPGVWTLKLAEGSRGAEIFEMVEGSVKGGRVSLEKESIGNNSTSKTLVMKDFVSRGEHLLLNRRPGYEEASLFFDKDVSTVTQDEEEEDIVHVFSLATGHLYERFLKIMMLSVTKRTSTKVKFWLFENYLSPTFKASARAMAERIGCEVEFVTYKWPGWLRAQSEKQRIIWGYKILFLDVLFPLNVKKIIYVDADQVVRGDLKELRDMDLQGAPYGYTPFCTSREATLGYQFWREGFWKRHLRGKPYHISALYVVDLETFRRTLVGDVLRKTYQQLSADPNSLSNLDQDLPNYAQHEVPIFSLPQEWLWCESWCSDETKATSKTIDLCNNPMHKEPKVSMAKRIISGELFPESWVELDAEVENYDQEYTQSLEAEVDSYDQEYAESLAA